MEHFSTNDNPGRILAYKQENTDKCDSDSADTANLHSCNSNGEEKACLSSTMTATGQARWFYNPQQKEYCRLELSGAESGGLRTCILVLLMGQGNSDAHYHPAFDEKFTALAGTLGLEVDGTIHLLEAGEELMVRKGQTHRFFNPGEQSILYRVSIKPAHEGFENFIRAHFYLSSRREMFSSQIPHNLLKAIVLYRWSGTRQKTWLFRLAHIVAPILYPIAKLSGVERRLLAKIQ